MPLFKQALRCRWCSRSLLSLFGTRRIQPQSCSGDACRFWSMWIWTHHQHKLFTFLGHDAELWFHLCLCSLTFRRSDLSVLGLKRGDWLYCLFRLVFAKHLRDFGIMCILVVVGFPFIGFIPFSSFPLHHVFKCLAVTTYLVWKQSALKLHRLQMCH